jgi:UDP-glucose 4-epimerase
MKNNPQIMVTGGLGINGIWVTRKLVEQGIRPVLFDVRDDFSLAGDWLRDKVDFVFGDVTSMDSLTEAIATYKPSCIIHMAAAISGFHQDLRKTFAVNAMGTVNLLEAAAQGGVKRVVFTSSRAAYGSITGPSAHPTYVPIREEHPAWPANAYDVGKLASEVMGNNYAADTDLEFVALRFAAIYGPGKLKTHGEFGILSKMVEKSLAGEEIDIPRGGEQQDDVIYVEDVAEAVVLAALHVKPSHTLYNISRNQGTTLHDFADAVRASIPEARITIGPGLDYLGVGSSYFGVMDNTRAREDLGFTPKYDLKAGVAAYISRLKETRP